jgi:hypothetical protein
MLASGILLIEYPEDDSHKRTSSIVVPRSLFNSTPFSLTQYRNGGYVMRGEGGFTQMTLPNGDQYVMVGCVPVPAWLFRGRANLVTGSEMDKAFKGVVEGRKVFERRRSGWGPCVEPR